MCRRQPGIGTYFPCTFITFIKDDFSAIGRLCEKCDGKWYASAIYIRARFGLIISASPVCDSYVRPETLVRICDECNFGTYGGRCIICGSPGIHCIFTLHRIIAESMDRYI